MLNGKTAAALLLIAALPVLAGGQDEVEELKKMIADQQRQIDELRALVGRKSEPNPEKAPAPAAAIPEPRRAELQAAASPLQFKIGDAYITPFGFMDFTSITRSTNPGSGIGTNFGSIPYANTQAGSLSEWRLSPQNSRIGLRVDAMVKGAKILGYLETDFLGQLGNPPNGGIAVSSNSYPPRLRLYWVDLRKNKFEFMAGQSWSLLTPGRKGISPLPDDLSYTQDIDVNYQAGLVWGRMPEVRFVYHPTNKAAFGLALDNSEPYIGGANGGSAIAFPAAFANAVGSQINNGASVISSAALHPDIIAKLAFDPSNRLHLEIAGVEITNKVSNPAGFQTHTKVGAGGSVNLSFAVAKNFRLLTNNYWSDGGGRYIFGQAPDFILRSDGSISPVHSGSTVTGFEAAAGTTKLYGYYGGIYIQKNIAADANGARIGYGPLTSGGQNRTIQEATFGTDTTIWKDPRYGALNLMFQYSYLQRNPWLASGATPSDAHLHMGFVNLRYTLPGSAPVIEK